MKNFISDRKFLFVTGVVVGYYVWQVYDIDLKFSMKKKETNNG